MKSIQTLILFFAAALVFMACNKVSMKKTKGGMPYQLYSGKGSVKSAQGNFLKINYTQSIRQSGKDSVYFSTRGQLPLYIPVMPPNGTYDISEILIGLRKGDSIIATQMMDTFIKRNPTNIPPQFKNGDVITTVVHVLEVFATDSARNADEKAENDKFLAGEISFLEKYLADKKIQVQKTPSGSFVQIINPGQGNLIDSGKVASVNYTGTSFSGKKFDSNTDTAFHHVEVMSFPVGTGQMIKGFDEAMRFLRPGAEAKVYIPSMLAYGARPQSPDIKPFEHLIFDIKVVDVKDNQPQTQDPRVKVDMSQGK
jgi:FKBP-type peptidyl-prolyl cis-trans isomerase FkpA